MAYTIKENTFSLFHNDKGDNDKRPDWAGKGKINGKEVRVSLWLRKSASGIEYLSGSISEAVKPAEEPQAVAETKEEILDDSQIPF